MSTPKPIRFIVVLSLVVFTVSCSPADTASAEPQPRDHDQWQAADPLVRLTNRGVALLEQYDYAKAADAFEQALKLAPESTETRVNLAIAVFNRAGNGDPERAEELLDQVIRDRPDDVRALFFRGVAHQYGGRDEQAASCFQRVLEAHPHDAYTWYLLARSKSHLDQPYREDLQRAVQENPALASAYYDLMRVAAKEGKREEAKGYQASFAKLRQSPLCEVVAVPHYRQTGPLAVARPLSGRPKRSVTPGTLTAAAAHTVVKASAAAPLAKVDARQQLGVQVALADVNGDGHLDMVTTDGRSLALLLGRPDRQFDDATAASGLTAVERAVSCAFGDYDNDDRVDLFVSCIGANHLFRGRGDGTFEDVTEQTKTAGLEVVSLSAVFLDADHDGDLDIYVCNATAAAGTAPAANQLLNNNTDGTFTDIAADAGVACALAPSVMLAPADLDADRDTDLVVFNQGAEVQVFFNDRLGKYHPASISAEPIRGDRGGVVQDFNGDGRPDLLVFPNGAAPGRLYLVDATGSFEPSAQFDGCVRAIATWGRPERARVADVDLDGDLDIVMFTPAGHVLLNDGWGQFVAQPKLWPAPADGPAMAADLADLTGDGVPDVLHLSASAGGEIQLVPTVLTPPSNWSTITPTGSRGNDKRTRSPASGFGTRLEVRSGLHSQILIHTGLAGGLSQSQQPVTFGLNGVSKADYLALVWPDGVTQCETDLAAGTHHRISETERRVSSCPVLFTWNGSRFEFLGDFAGVGGLGYFVAPGESADPQLREQVKIEAHQLAPRDGFYELRLCEPMEEVAYVDRLELLAVDHPADMAVFPDERLVVAGDPPTHRLLAASKRLYPVAATTPQGEPCADRLTEADRAYAYDPPLDRRFVGFCQPHTLTLDFGSQLDQLDAGQRVYLFITASIEYPYSQTVFAAGQAGVQWQPPAIDQERDGRWETIVPDAGVPGGIGRTIAVDLTGKLAPGCSRLRIRTNLELYYDRVFIAADAGAASLTTQPVPLANANLRRLGFPLEYSPDGAQPTIYTYDVIEPTISFKMPRGAYTRYGPVEPLLTEADDRYVILGTGDEIALRFDARSLSPLRKGYTRSFILVSDVYCKDMDLYTVAGDTVTPLPFKRMSGYPYPKDEQYPAPDDWQARFNTRQVP